MIRRTSPASRSLSPRGRRRMRLAAFGFWSFVACGCFGQAGVNPDKGYAPWVGNSLDGIPCSGKEQGYGPYNYTNPRHRAKYLPLVNRAHFDQYVETLRGAARGKNATPYGDLDYTLRAFPNHHRALYAIIRYYQRPEGRRDVDTPPECYLERAIRFDPDDHNLYTLKGIYLHRMGHLDMALEAYDKAEKLSGGDGELFYNKGLLLFDLGRYTESKAYAEQALERQYPLPGLKEKLKSKGQW